MNDVIVRGHSSCFGAPALPSSSQWVSPRPRHGAGGWASRRGCLEHNKSPPESKSLCCASGCVLSSCKAAASLPGSPGFSPPRRAPSGSPPCAGRRPPSPVAASPSGSEPARSEAWLQWSGSLFKVSIWLTTSWCHCSEGNHVMTRGTRKDFRITHAHNPQRAQLIIKIKFEILYQTNTNI